MTGSRRRTTMSATEALAFLRSRPTADNRVLAAQPLLDRLQAPGLAPATMSTASPAPSPRPGLEVHTNLALQTFP